MAIINLKTTEGRLVNISTPFGFSCATNYYCAHDVSPRVIGPCELYYMIIYTVRVESCSSNFPGKNLIVSHVQFITDICCMCTVSISQTKPPNRTDVCPLESVEYTCTANYDELGWYFNRNWALYRPTGRTYGYSNITIFETELVSSNNVQILSNATIKNVSVEYDGLSIECHDIGDVPASKKIQVEGIYFYGSHISIRCILAINMHVCACVV